MNRTGQKWLIIGAHNPYPARNGSALRVRQHIEVLKAQGAEVHYWGIARPGELRKNVRIFAQQPWSELAVTRKALLAPRLLRGVFQGYDPNASFLFSHARDQDLRYMIREVRPTHVLISESWMCKYVDAIADEFVNLFFSGPRYEIVFDLHNVETMLRREVACSKTLLGKMWENFRTESAFVAEEILCEFADEVWVCSESDALAVQELFGKGTIGDTVVVPNKVHFDSYKNVYHTPLRTIGMVGIWSYAPNGRAAESILNDVWPGIPEATPILVGRNPTKAMQEAKAKGALVTGEVPDVRPSLGKIRTMVIPLTEGGGTRMKVLEAMAAGIPVVATAKAVEGIEGRHMEHFIVCEPEEMAGWVKRFWDHSLLENEIRINARKLVQEKYSW